MNRNHILLFLLAAGAPVHAETLSGIFTADDNILVVPFTKSTPGLVVIQTLSFAASGGFAPVISLFDATGPQPLLGFDHNGGPGPGCGARATDAATGYCWDGLLSMILNAGSYLLTLTEDDNLPNGPNFTDGFFRQGQGDFTGPSFTGSPGKFLLVTGQQRNGGFTLSLSGNDPLAAVPEPGTFYVGAVVVLSAVVRQARLRRRRRWTATGSP